MEFLGDSFLKIGVTRSIYDSRPKETAGQLSRSRTSFVRNSNLVKLQELYYKTEYDEKEIHIVLPSLINCTSILEHSQNTLVKAPFYVYEHRRHNENVQKQGGFNNRHDHNPVRTDSIYDENGQKSVELRYKPSTEGVYNEVKNGKRIADCVESLIGAYCVTGGEKMAARFMWILNEMYKYTKSSSSKGLKICHTFFNTNIIFCWRMF